MSYETELSNIAHKTDEISVANSVALVESVVCLPHVYAENLPSGTATKLFRKRGSLTATSMSESATWSFGSGSEYTEATVSLTAAKLAQIAKYTVEASQFSGSGIDVIAAEQGRALARDADDDVLALFGSFSSSQTATNILTLNDLHDAAYKVLSGTAGVSKSLVAILDFKGANEIRKEVANSGASQFAVASQLSLLAGLGEANGYVGSMPGIAIFQTVGLSTSGGDDVAAVFDPAIALCGMYSPSVMSEVVMVLSGGMYAEIAAYIFAAVGIWNNAAGCKLLSDT